MSVQFRVAGPFPICLKKEKRSTLIDQRKLKEFWDRCESDAAVRDLRNRNGCYVFGMQRSRNIVPFYVGKTCNGYANEVFRPFQINKYNSVVHLNGTPVLFFIYKSARTSEGQVTQAIIRELERFLIQISIPINADLLNVQGTRAAQWSIQGVVRSVNGAPSRSSIRLATMLRLRAPKRPHSPKDQDETKPATESVSNGALRTQSIRTRKKEGLAPRSPVLERYAARSAE
jgi:hypothetical protein